jgi:hypothetical protein
MRARVIDPELQRRVQAAPAMTDAQRARQVISLAYGNAKLENDRITKPLVTETAKADPR